MKAQQHDDDFINSNAHNGHSDDTDMCVSDFREIEIWLCLEH